MSIDVIFNSVVHDIKGSSKHSPKIQNQICFRTQGMHLFELNYDCNRPIFYPFKLKFGVMPCGVLEDVE